MEIILKEDFPSLGYVGDRINVRPGYARNYLLPRGIAVEVSGRNKALVKHQLDGIAAKRRRLKGIAESQASELAAVNLEFTLKIGKKGKSFGSITTRDIEKALIEKGYELDRKRIKLGEPIRRAGEFTVELKLHSEVAVPVKVKVTPELVVEKEEEQHPDDLMKDSARNGDLQSAEDAALEGESPESGEMH